MEPLPKKPKSSQQKFLQEEGLDEKVRYMVVSEAGASVYSASKLAAGRISGSGSDSSERRVHRASASGSPGRTR